MLITSLWAQQPGKFFCISTKSGGGKWKDHFFAPDEFGTIRAFLQDNADSDIYFCPHGFNRRARTKDEAVPPHMCYADLDFVDPRILEIKPTIAIESSPGRFVGLWLSRDPVDESINRRLTYHTGADKGGWDLSQVLRFPGTKNYKYKSQPKVRVLWDDGPTYTSKKLDKLLPQEENVGAQGELYDPVEVMKLYQSKLPRWARRELVSKKMTRGTDRSEMLWKLENVCIESGMTQDEAFVLLKRSVWNKFAGRRTEDTQLRRELEKVYTEQFSAQKPKGAEKRHDIKGDREYQHDDDDEEDTEKRFKFLPMSRVKPEKLDFLWYPYLVRGELSLLEGDPGLGKSYMAQMICGAIATGQALPFAKRNDKTPPAHGPVVYFDIENSAGTVTAVRLKHNGFKDLDNYYQIEVPFSIDDEDALDEIYEHLEAIKPSIVVFDTLNTYIGRADTHKASEVTQAFGQFKKIASDFNCAVLVLRHLTKGAGSAMYRGQGSIAFSGLARVVMSCGVDPEDSDTRAMAITKINFAKPPQAVTFRIEERPNDRSQFIWGDYVNLSSQQIMDAASASRAEGTVGQTLQDVMEFLEKELSKGPIPGDKLARMAEKRSYPRKMLERAADKLGINRERKGTGPSRDNEWKLPDREEAGA